MNVEIHKINTVSFNDRVNNCVGENNQKYFVLFTVSSASLGVMLSLSAACVSGGFQRVHDWNRHLVQLFC